jgi:anti-anti-sigma factor
MPANGFFDIEQHGDTMILTPTADMGELEFDRFSDGMKTVLDTLEHAAARNLLLDFHKTTYFGSTALGFFVRLWKVICDRKGRMAFCNLTAHQKEILQVTKLDGLWDLCETRESALKRLGS